MLVNCAFCPDAATQRNVKPRQVRRRMEFFIDDREKGILSSWIVSKQ